MEKLFYETRPYFFLFGSLKALTFDGNYLAYGVLLAGAALLTYVALILLSRWKHRGYFGMSTHAPQTVTAIPNKAPRRAA